MPTMIASSSVGLMPARSSAVRLASVAICASDSPWRIRKRWPIPVRDAYPFVGGVHVPFEIFVGQSGTRYGPSGGDNS